jgi:hypothetical protein
MSSCTSRTNLLVCLTVLTLIASACQLNVPAAATPTPVATTAPTSAAPAIPANAYPQPYPDPYPLLPTLDPYLAPALPYPGAYPAQVAPPAPGEAAVLYPGVLDGAEVYWTQAVAMLQNGEVEQVMQTHDLKVYLTVKDGRTLFSFEPQIDEVLKVIQSCGDLCKNILVATE